MGAESLALQKMLTVGLMGSVALSAIAWRSVVSWKTLPQSAAEKKMVGETSIHIFFISLPMEESGCLFILFLGKCRC